MFEGEKDPYEIDLDQLDLDGDEPGAQDEPETDPQGEVPTEQESVQELIEVLINGIPEKKSLDELKQGYMQNADYTRKTQTHANQVKEWETQKEQELTRLFEEKYGHYGQLDGLFQQYPGLEEGVVGYIQNALGQAQAQNPQGFAPQMDIAQHPQFRQMQEQMNQFQQTFQSQEQARQEQAQAEAARQELDKLIQAHPDVQGKENEVLMFAVENKLNNLEFAYKLMNFDTIQKQTSQQIMENQMKRKQNAQVKPQSTSGSTKKEAPAKPKSYDEIENMILSGEFNLYD